MVLAFMLVAVSLIGLGAVASYLVLVSLAIHREEKGQTMTLPTSDKVARGARITMGVHARRPALIHEPVYYRRDRSSRPDEEL